MGAGATDLGKLFNAVAASSDIADCNDNVRCTGKAEMTVSVLLLSATELPGRPRYVSPRAISVGNVGSKTATGAQGRFALALDSKNLFIFADNFAQLHNKETSSHRPFDRTTELRALGIGTLAGATMRGNPGGDIEPATRPS